MTSLTINERERQRLASIASEYESKGYEVKLRPPACDLPDFLTGYDPDLIAIGKGEIIVVKVKAREEFKDDQAVAALESVLRNRPGWRFELIIEGSAEEDRKTLGPIQIRAALEEADELQEHGHFAAALLLLWSAIEGALRLLASRENVELESLAPKYVVRRLYTLGLLGREQYQILDEAIRIRNQVAHGFQMSVTPQHLVRIAAVSHELLSQVEVKAA